jgi:hypothetical protein
MQQFLKLVRRLVYPAAVLLLVWAGYQVIASPYISDSGGKILVVYDGESTVRNCDEPLTPDRENDSEEALAGFCDAMPKHGQEDLLNLHAELHDTSEGKAARVYQQLASRVASGGVLGVVSFLASPDSPPVIRFCRTMQIPLLLAVAANDDLLAPAEDTRGIVFRMMPTNGRQARNIADWMRKHFRDRKPPLRVAVFHEPNSFGEFLHRQLMHELLPDTANKDVMTYNYEVTAQMEFADLMPQLWCGKIDLAIYLGFKPRALDLLNKLKWYRADVDQVSCPTQDSSGSFKKLTVLLSSGGYQEDLNDTDKYAFPFDVFAMLPTSPAGTKDVSSPAPKLKQTNQETEYFEYGHDSYTLLERLAAQKFRIPSQPMEHSETGHSYSFDESGELAPADKNKYQAYALASSPAGGKP